MSETLLSGLPQTICDEVSFFLPDLKECKPHAGKFSLEELKKRGLAAPALLVSVLGAKQDDTYSGGAHAFMLQMAGYVVTKGGAVRDIAAANICQVLLSFIPGQRWGQNAIGEARNVRMHTLVSSKTKNHAVSLWAVTWDQPISFCQPEDQPLGAALYVSQAPMIGADHEDKYELVGGQG